MLSVLLLCSGATALQAQFRFRAEPGMAVPLGEYATFARPGLGLHLSGRLPVAAEQLGQRLMVGLDFGYYQHEGKNRTIDAFSGWDYELFDAYRSIPLQAAGDYVFWQQKPLRAFGSLGLGTTFLQTRSEFNQDKFVSGQDSLNPSLTTTRLRAFRFSITPGAGLQLWFNKRIALELVGRYQVVVTQQDDREPVIGIRVDELGRPVQLLQLNTGVVIRFAKR
jgi:opacity protein-like surface antigen